MYYLMYAWSIASNYKLGNDLVLISQRCKNPIQVLLEHKVNDYAQRAFYNSFIYRVR